MPSSTSGSERALAWALAALLAVGAGAWLVAPDPDPHSRLPEATRLDPDCPGAEVVVVGNSRAASDLDPDVLEAALGLPGGAVASLTLAGSSLPTWVALVEHGVYGRGCRPALVLVYGALPSLIVAEPPAHEREVYLAALRPGAGTGVDGGALSAAWARARERAVGVREATFRGLAASVAGAWTGKAGRDALDRAMDRGFAGAATETERVSPIVESSAEGVVEARTPAGTWLDELAEVVGRAGSRLVVVRCPTSRDDDEKETAEARETLAGAIRLVEATGGAYLDRPGGVLEAGYYADGKHLLPAGAVLNSREVAAALARTPAWTGRSGARGSPAGPR